VQLDFLEKLKNIGTIWASSPEKAFRAEQELISEFLSQGEGLSSQSRRSSPIPFP